MMRQNISLTLLTDGEDHEGMAIDIAREANSKGKDHSYCICWHY